MIKDCARGIALLKLTTDRYSRAASQRQHSFLFPNAIRGSLFLYPLIARLKLQSNGPSYSNTVIGILTVYEWAVTFGTARRGLGAVPNVTAHPSTASVPTSYYTM